MVSVAKYQKRPNAPQPIWTVGTRHRISGLLPPPRPAEGRLKRIVHHWVAPPFHMRRALPLRTFRLAFVLFGLTCHCNAEISSACAGGSTGGSIDAVMTSGRGAGGARPTRLIIVPGGGL